MDPITRRRFFKGTAAVSVCAALPAVSEGHSADAPQWPGGDPENGVFRLSLYPGDGLRNTRLVHLSTGLVLADADYSYSFGRPEFQPGLVSKTEDGSVVVQLQGTALSGTLQIQQEFRLPQGQPS